MGSLPIDDQRTQLLEAMRRGPVVLTAPTGSGKSTQVPRWCEGRVAVVEPRRVACKTLAARVAFLEECELGAAVGYQVRDDSRCSDATRITFMTPGIALRRLGDVMAHDTVIVDELHERAMDVDLILALLKQRFGGRLLAMSATLDAAKVASYLGGVHVHAEVRQFSVDVHYQGGPLLPELAGLEARVVTAIDATADHPGDVLVFLPGKAEIASVAALLAGRRNLTVLPLHGGLSLEEQARAFAPCDGRKVVLSTNVAETSVTVPGVGVAIDSGLVRRTRYHRGRGFLTLMPVALDSASQRAGRAGRTMAGVCHRLWREAANLEPTTAPEIRRESLLPLVIAAASSGTRVEELSFLDPPADYAVEAAVEEARSLGALDTEGGISDTGRALFGLPLDAPLGRLLVEARERETLLDAIDLVAALGVGRPIFAPRLPPPSEDEDDLRRSCCDATALVLAVRRGRAGRDPVIGASLAEARRAASRLRRAMGLSERIDPAFAVDREALCRTAIAADPRCAHIPRQRKRRVAWSNGGTEIELGRDSAAQHAERLDALVVLETRALGERRMKTTVIATCVAPAPLAWLVAEGLGRDRVAAVKRRGDDLVVTVERVFAKKVIAERILTPTGELARRALARLIADGELFGETRATTAQRLRDQRLAAGLAARGLVETGGDADDLVAKRPEEWLFDRLTELGVEHAHDVALLSAADVTAPELPWSAQQALDAHFPVEVSTADAKYAVTVDLDEGEVTLRYLGGARGRVPARSALPSFGGFKVKVDTGMGWAVAR